MVAVAKKFLDDRASTLAALIAYYAFVSLFPLLLVFVSVLGFVLQGDPSLQEDIVDSALARIPVIGAQLGDDVEPLTGSGVALVIGIVGALWAGLGVTLAIGRAFEAIWDVPRLEQRSGVRARAWGLVALAALGAALIAATAVGGLAVSGPGGPVVQRVGALVLSLLVNGAVYLAAFLLLAPHPLRIPELLPGTAVAAIGSVALQAAGGWYVERAVTRAGETYGTFALVIGLLSWFWLVSHLLLIAADVNVVLHGRLWPRSLTGELEAADRRVLRRAAEAARQDPRERIEVSFEAGLRSDDRVRDDPAPHPDEEENVADTTTRSPQEVFQHHAQALGAGDLEGIVSDYADDAVFITPDGIRRGKDEVREAFTKLLGDVPDAAWELPTEIYDGDVLFLEWKATSDRTRVEDGIDTFVFRDGQIAVQTVRYTLLTN